MSLSATMAVLAALLTLGSAVAARADAPIHGLPFTRSYPLEEIGSVSRGAHLNFDAFGRLTLVQEGVYAVLNDTTWSQLAEPVDGTDMGMANVVEAPNGLTYYGGRGSWGTVRLMPSGRLHPMSLVPPEAPKWTQASSFDHIVPMRDGVYFAGIYGVVYYDFARKDSRFFEVPNLAEIFPAGGRMFVSAHGRPLQFIDVVRGVLTEVPDTDFGGNAVELATPLDDRRTLMSVRDGRLLVFDGEQASQWAGQVKNGLTGSVSAVQHLAEGGAAVAITGEGLFLVSANGELVSALTTPQYQRITRLASREPGVLWVSVEDAIEKVFYGGAYTLFGQRLGLPISWPGVYRWGDRFVVYSGGRLYRSVTRPRGSPGYFEEIEGLPPGEGWTVAASGQQLLAGNNTGVFVGDAKGGFTRVITMDDVLHLAMVRDDLCFVLGRHETAALRRSEGRWTECARRVRSGDPPGVVHTTKRAMWIEYGASKVARVSLDGDRIVQRLFDEPEWKDALWVNIGFVDDIVMFTATAENRKFFDDRTGQFCDAPALRRLLARTPFAITRLQKDDTGTIWASHRRGVVTFTPKDGDYVVDNDSFDLLNDMYPFVEVLPGNDVWFTCGRSLFHVERRHEIQGAASLPPTLVSVVDGRTNSELYDRTQSSASSLRFPFDRGSLRFRFFSGTYARRHPPVYEFRLNGRDGWESLGAGAPLSFPGLGEGEYHLEIRAAGGERKPSPPTAIDFKILPPWYRTWPAFGLYGVTALLAVFGIVRWSNARARARTLVLERLVRERTHQLEATMEKLNEETRISATVAERNRLAGEIHDSLQQALSGAILQLDATLRLSSLTGQIRSRLEVVRNMVSFTRHEVQRAVWDLESPLLEDTDLGEALRKLTVLINYGSAQVGVEVAGDPVQLTAAVKHHLLRIAQEATTNAVRHAQAEQISMRLEYQGDTIDLSVSDNGVGFQPAEALAHRIGHFGLRGIRDRARKIGGELEVHSAPGEGTVIRVVVPVANPQPIPADASVTPV